MMKILSLLVVAIFQGCYSLRNSAIPDVNDLGPSVSTRNRYRLSCVYKGETSETMRFKTDFFQRCEPRVFSPGGIPVSLRIQFDRFEGAKGWTVLFAMCTLGVIPQHNQLTYICKCSLELADEDCGKSQFRIANVFDEARSQVLIPTAYLFYNGAPSVDDGRRAFYENMKIAGTEDPPQYLYESDPAKRVESDEPFRRALAYAMAVKLKEMEDSGKIDAMLRKKEESRSTAPAHSVVQLDRDAKDGFSYSFAIEFASAPSDFKSAARAVLQDFMKSIKEEYLDTYPSADIASLVVSFSGLKREGVRISGHAAVLTIKPLSLTYDANTRRGKLTVKFNAGQAEEARAWIRKNVKTLARDKNIALVTGQLPPEASCYFLDEKVDGNVMEVKFKTE